MRPRGKVAPPVSHCYLASPASPVALPYSLFSRFPHSASHSRFLSDWLAPSSLSLQTSEACQASDLASCEQGNVPRLVSSASAIPPQQLLLRFASHPAPLLSLATSNCIRTLFVLYRIPIRHRCLSMGGHVSFNGGRRNSVKFVHHSNLPIVIESYLAHAQARARVDCICAQASNSCAAGELK